MYNENNNLYDDNDDHKIPVRRLLLLVLVVVLFVLAAIWYFVPRDNGEVESKTNANWFYDNTDEMKAAAKKYYTDDKLPKDIDKSVKMSLSEMINLKLIKPLKNDNGKLCDTQGSYVEITKSNIEYVVKTSLTCPGEKKDIVEHMGSYSLDAQACNLATKLYQLQRKWYKGYIVNTTGSKMQYKHVKYGQGSTIVGYNYSCSAGTLSGTTCLKNETVKNYLCSSGTIVSATDHRCKITNTTYTYSCPSGYSNLSNKTCYKSEPVNTYSCSSGTLVSDTDHRCKIANTTYSYSCPATYTSSGSGSSMTCSKSVANGTSQVYVGTGEAKSIPANTSTKKYVSTGTRSVKDCSACASYILYTYKIYNIVTNYKTVYEDRIATPSTTYSYVNASLTTTTKQTPIAAIETPATTYSYVNATTKDILTQIKVPATATPKYDSRTVIIDTKWTFNATEAGYSMVTKQLVASGTNKIYTPSWVLTLPKGYQQSEVKTEEKWSSKNAEAGWTFTGKTKESN